MELTIQGDAAIVADFRAFPGRTTKAMVRALNRAIASGRTVMVREIAQDTGLRSTDVRNALPMREATVGRPVASLAASLKRIPLIKFNARGPEPSRGQGRGVSYRLRGSKGRLPHAFIATMGSGHRGVFMRRSTRRLPIVELHGPSLGRVFAKYRPAGVARVHEAFVKNFDHELAFARTQGATSGGAD